MPLYKYRTEKNRCSAEPVFELLSIARASSVLGLDDRRLYSLVQAGEIPTVRMGNRYMIDRSALISWVNAGGSKSEVKISGKGK
jgi:excisionase family DNA binding protein